MKKILLTILCLSVILFAGCAAGTNATQSGTVSFTVIDGLTGVPVEGVKIVLPESKQTLVTDSNGKTEQIEIPVETDARAPLKQDYGTFTVLGYCDGYHKYALFYAQIRPDQERNMKVFLFPEDSPMSNGAPLAVVESPDRDWVARLVDSFQ